MAEKTYSAFFTYPGDEIVGLVDWNEGGGDSLERVDGEWIPLEEDSFESLNGLPIDTMSEDIVSVFDEAEAEDRTLTRSELEQFIVKAESE